jgi:Pro-kumamolisin, activation domain
MLRAPQSHSTEKPPVMVGKNRKEQAEISVSPFFVVDQVRKTSASVPSLRWIKSGKPLRPSRLCGGSSPENLCARPVSAVDQVRKTSAPVPSLRWIKSRKPLRPSRLCGGPSLENLCDPALLTMSNNSSNCIDEDNRFSTVAYATRISVEGRSHARVEFMAGLLLPRSYPEERENCALASPEKRANRSGDARASNSPSLNPDRPIAKVVRTSHQDGSCSRVTPGNSSGASELPRWNTTVVNTTTVVRNYDRSRYGNYQTYPLPRNASFHFHDDMTTRIASLSPARISALIVCLLVPLSFSSRGADKQVLHGHVPSAVARLQAVDRLPGTNRLQLAIGLPLHNREALTNLLQQIYEPTSANYHHYLRPEEFTEAFGPTEQEYQAAISFAKANGWTVTGTPPNRTLLDVNGSVADVENALHVNMHVYPHPTEARTFKAPDVEPLLDLSLRVLHISGLDNYMLPHPMSLREHALARMAVAAPRVGSGPNGAFIGNDFRNAYVQGTSLSGAGQAVGLFELSGYYASDITEYETQAGLPNVPLQNVLIDGFNGSAGGHRPGSLNEAVALDIEMTISMAPGLSQVLVYEGSPTSTTASINDILNRMATDNLAKQLSCSWGFDIDVTTEQIFQQYAAQGQSFFLASGDSEAFSGAVFQPADNPFITIVGGTDLTTGNAQAWVSETTWNGSSGESAPSILSPIGSKPSICLPTTGPPRCGTSRMWPWWRTTSWRLPIRAAPS